MKYLHFDCDERVNLFVGPNASGKTTILRTIKGSYSESRENRLQYPVALSSLIPWATMRTSIWRRATTGRAIPPLHTHTIQRQSFGTRCRFFTYRLPGSICQSKTFSGNGPTGPKITIQTLPLRISPKPTPGIYYAHRRSESIR